MACPHLSSSEFGGSGSSRGRQEGQRIAPAATQEQWHKQPESEWPPEPWCGVYRSPPVAQSSPSLPRIKICKLSASTSML
ncbi:hypothetical protein CsSME_00046178 [Camellia sinensis var. sinensis]